MPLKIANAILPDRLGRWNLEIQNDRIAAITPSPPATPIAEPSLSDPATIDAAGRLLIPSLVDAHIHLDKAFLLDRCQAKEGSFREAMQETLAAKRSFTHDDIQTRARRIIERSIAAGTTVMRSHVEVDLTIGLTGMQALLPLQREYAWGLSLQLAVFAQEGITNQPGIIPRLQQALEMGGNAIGSAPYVDPDPEQNIRTIFDLAQTFNCEVDFHLDYLDDDAPLALPIVIAETERRGWQGRVCLGHMTRLAGLTPSQLEAIASQIRSAGISILALPASDIYIMAQKDTHNVRRGVAPIHLLAGLGVNTGLAVNNVQNLFTPFGDGDVLKICTLLAQLLQLGTPAQHQLCLEMATTRAAQAIGISNHTIAPGNLANLVIVDATSVTEAIAAAPLGRTVIHRGKVVAQSRVDRQLFSQS